MSHRRLRLTCESALRIAEWQLQQERRQAIKRRLEPPPAPPRKGRDFAWYSLVLFVVGALVLLAIEVSKWKVVEQRYEIALGLLLVALATAALIVPVVALTYRRSQSRPGGT